jgi:hypothetical protein
MVMDIIVQLHAILDRLFDLHVVVSAMLHGGIAICDLGCCIK